MLEHHVQNEEKEIDGFSTVKESSIGQSKVTRKWTDDEFAAQCLIFVSSSNYSKLFSIA